MSDDETRARLRKIIPLLGSDKPGEVAATAATVTRLLAALHRDWHDLAAIVDKALVGSSPRAAPKAERPPPGHWWKTLAWQLATRGRDSLTDRDMNFLCTIVERRQAPSPAQHKWLDDIVEKMREPAS